jgi:PRC-barrel domain
VRNHILGQDGKIEAVVIGVGGFLGIGEHNVAVPFDQVKFVGEPRRVATADTVRLPQLRLLELALPMPAFVRRVSGPFSMIPNGRKRRRTVSGISQSNASATSGSRLSRMLRELPTSQ